MYFRDFIWASGNELYVPEIWAIFLPSQTAEIYLISTLFNFLCIYILPKLIFICTYVANYIEKRDLVVYSVDFGTGKNILVKVLLKFHHKI